MCAKFVKIGSIVSEFGSFLCWVVPLVSPEAPLQNLYPAHVTFTMVLYICVKFGTDRDTTKTPGKFIYIYIYII